MMKVNYYTCPDCGKKYKTLTGFGEHVDTMHPGLRPEDYSVSRYFYFVKTGRTEGKCRICGKATEWNEKSMKYNQFCTDPKCKETYAKEAKKRMRDKYGKTHLLNDPDQQRKMLQGRRISGKYRFKDGTEFPYTGSYEKKFFEMMDTLMDWDTCDIMAPSPHNYFYEYKNPKDKDHEGRKFYIPDVYIPSLNLEIEIKQQTSTNQAFNEQMRPREKAKDEAMKANPKVNYLKINDNNFAPFFEYLMTVQEADPKSKDEVDFKATESYIPETIAEESVIKDDKDLRYNTDKFGKGDNKTINLLLVTGFSGSGKSSIADKLSKEVDEVVCLDDVITIYRFSDDNLKEYGDLMSSFFLSYGKKFRIPCTTKPGGVHEWLADNGFSSQNDYNTKVMDAFMKHATKYADSHKDKLYIIEGIQLLCFENANQYKDYAVIIKGTSAIKSWYRSFKRDMQEAISKEEKREWAMHKIKSIPDYSIINSKINQWRSTLSKYMTVSNENDLNIELTPPASKVFFTRDISPESVLKLYRAVGVELPGNVAVKLHSGEPGNQNFLGPNFWKPVIDRVGGTVVECNTAYGSPRDTTDKHKIVMTRHGWDKYFPVDIMDGDEKDNEIGLPVEPHNVIKNNLVGSHIENYNSMLVLSHFKGHPMGGFGGALKNIAIGCASRNGKKQIHRQMNSDKISINGNFDQNEFLAAMADAASTIAKKFSDRIVFINAMVNLSVDCDCVKDAEDPCMRDIGLAASIDPIALDRFCLDMIHKSTDPGRDHLLERIESKNGEKIIEYAENLGFGTGDYVVINIDPGAEISREIRGDDMSSMESAINDWVDNQNVKEFVTKITERWTITGKDGEEHTLVKLKDDNKNIYRMKSEVLILNDKNQVLLQFMPDGSYDIPGGGMDATDSPVDSVIRETNEEIKAHVKDLQYFGDYHFLYDGKKTPKWITDNIPENKRWTGCYGCVFVGKYDGSYTGYVSDRDTDEMADKAKWYDIDEIFGKLKPIHQKAIRKYINNPTYLVTPKEIATESDESTFEEVENSVVHTDIKEKWNIKSPDGAEHTCVTLTNGKIYRTKSEVLILNNTGDKILLWIKDEKKKDYDIPGGGWNIGETAEDSAIRECKEEVRIIIKDVMHYSDYTFEYPKSGTPDWIKKSVREEDRWIGGYVSVFVARDNGTYTGYIQKVDRDEMVNKAKWYDLNEVYSMLKPIHKKALQSYLNNPYTINKVASETFMDEYVNGTAYDFNAIWESLNCLGLRTDNYYVTKAAAEVLAGNCRCAAKIDLVVRKDCALEIEKRGATRVTWKDRVDYILHDIMMTPMDDTEFNKQMAATNCVAGIHIMAEVKKPEIATEKSTYSKRNCYPVYVVLEYTGALLGNIVRKVTKDEFTHACISLNDTLDPLYSFGNYGTKPSIKDSGFVIQKGPKDPFYRLKKSVYRVYVIYVSKSEYNKIQKRLDYFIENRESFKFDLTGLVNIFFGKDSESHKEKYFCSRFVMDVVNSGRHKEKYFCSRFVMDVVNSGRHTAKLPSLYKPQDIANYEDEVLVNAGTDFFNYDVKITRRNMKLLRQHRDDEIVAVAGESYVDWLPEEKPATEDWVSVASTLFTFLINDPYVNKAASKKWDDYLFQKKNLMGSTMIVPFVGVKIEGGLIEIRGINYTLLKNRIKRHYVDQSIYNIFIPKYNAFSYKKFERKRIGRSQIKIDYLYTEEFFALELITLFNELGRRFRDKTYRSMAKTIYEKSWVGRADKNAENVSSLSTKNLSRMSMELNDYQKEFISQYPKLKAQLNLNGYILAFEQGLGKTITAVGLAECLNVDHVYVVCPNSLKENWALEIKKYFDKYKDDDTWRDEVFICSDKAELFNANTAKYIIINNESIPKMFPYVMDGKNILVLDESHNFRNIDSKRVNELIQLKDKLKCNDVLVMSGTPIKATPAEITPALLLIDPTFTMEAARIFTKTFKLQSSLGTSLIQNRFAKMIYRKEKDVLENKLPQKHIDTMKLGISSGSKYTLENTYNVVFNRFSEIYDYGYDEFLKLKKPFLIASKRYSTSDMDYPRFERIINSYVMKNRESLHEIDLMFMEDFISKVKANIRDKKERDHYDMMVKNYVRYRNHCLGVAFGEILPPYRRDMYNAMFDENRSIIDKMILSSVKKTLIFTQFKGVATHIHEALNDSGIGTVLIDGDVSDRMTVIREFKENPNILVLVATSQTLGTGVTLTEANQILFFGPPWRQSDFDQCSDRIHRIGQTDDCYIYLISLNTGSEKNLSDRMDEILKWSKTMVDASIHKTEDDSATKFEDALIANEGLLWLTEDLMN